MPAVQARRGCRDGPESVPGTAGWQRPLESRWTRPPRPAPLLLCGPDAVLAQCGLQYAEGRTGELLDLLAQRVLGRVTADQGAHAALQHPLYGRELSRVQVGHGIFGPGSGRFGQGPGQGRLTLLVDLAFACAQPWAVVDEPGETGCATAVQRVGPVQGREEAATQGVQRRLLGPSLADHAGKAVQDPFVGVEDEVFLEREVVADRHLRHVGGFGDLRDGDVLEAPLDEQQRRDMGQPVAGLALLAPAQAALGGCGPVRGGCGSWHAPILPSTFGRT
nr:TetR-family transcriptional regulator [uncultured bacterium]